jgi:ParB/RepB/Spo0J family partition protein
MEEAAKPSSLNVQDVQIDLFVPNPENINEMSEDDLRKLVAHISEVGIVSPIQAVPMQDGKYMILGGEHRWKAAKQLGMTYIPTVVLTDEKWHDSDLFDLVAFRLNVIKGSQNPEKFVKLYDRLNAKYGAESLKDVFAVTDKSLWKKLTKSIKSDMKKSGAPEDVLAKLEDADQKAKSFDQFTKQMNKILTKHASAVENGCIVFMNGGVESMMIKSSEKVFDSMKAISAFATSQGKNVNEYLEPVILDLVSKLK